MAVAGALLVGAYPTLVGSADAAAPRPPWLNSSKPVSARVSALLGAMTLAEKVGQMGR